MDNRLLVWGLVCAVAGAAAGVEGAGRSKALERPNILFIFGDDHAYNALGAYGNREVKTPHLDRLAASGTCFSRAYNMGAWSGAVCVASRAMLNTGRFVWHAQTVDFGTDMDREGRVVLWSERMRQLGYETYFAGKWHTMGDPARLFDHMGTLRGGMPEDAEEGYNRPLAGQPDRWSPSDPKFGGYWQGGRHWSEVLADEATGFIGQAAGSGKPFFMYLAFNAPHDPRQSPQEFVDLYPPDSLALPESFVPEYPYQDGMGCGRQLRDERLAPFPRTAHAVQVHRGEYYALVTHLDVQIGRILDALEHGGLAEKTIIIYSADHGLAIGAHGLMGKQNMFEHSMRAPLIFSGPGIEAGKRIDTPVYIQDLMPSALELAGDPVHAGVEFKSVLPLMRDPQAIHYGAVYGAFKTDLQRMVSKDGFKLILYPRIGQVLLFDLENDPSEMRDLSKASGYADKVGELFDELRRQQSMMGDTLDLGQFYP